jgi:hypothetical protein
MKPEQLASNLEKVIEEATEAFNEGLEASQKTAYNKIISLIKDIKLDTVGNIKKTAENVKILRGITKELNQALLTPTYKKRVANYVKTFDQIENEQLSYFKLIKSSFEVGPMLEVIKEQAIDTTIASLTETGLETYFTQPIKDILYRNISTGGSYSAFQEEIRTFILGNDDTVGRYLSYTRQITNDSLSIYSRQYNEAISKDLGLVFYKFVGGLKDTSRDFCEERNGKYFHIEEIKSWGRGEKCCGLSLPQKKNNSPFWPGMRKGTNENNILSFSGGYLCNHKMIAVSEAVVPKDVIERTKEKGYL